MSLMNLNASLMDLNGNLRNLDWSLRNLNASPWNIFKRQRGYAGRSNQSEPTAIHKPSFFHATM